MTGIIDLNAKRAARRATTGEFRILRVGNTDIRMRPEIPLKAMDKLDGDDMTGFLRDLVHPADMAQFENLEMSYEDVLDIVTAYMEQLGESAASMTSSLKTGLSSRLTSNASTDSTSPNPFGDKDLHDRLGSPTSSDNSRPSPPPPDPWAWAGA